MNRPRLLDLFCGAGGAGMGYHRAGFEVVGVDINPQPNYPFSFHLADALEFAADFATNFDAVHASPPCQAFTPLSALPGVGVKNPAVDLVAPTRGALVASGLPYVIENVVQAPLILPVTLCGTMFDLKIYRHRNFEANWTIARPVHVKHEKLCMRAGYLPTDERPFMSIHGRNGHNSKAWVRTAAEFMGMPWASADLNGVCEAIPPAYTEYIGRQLIQQLEAVA